MTTLVLADHINGCLTPGTLSTISAAKKLGNDITLLIAGHQLDKVVDHAKNIYGIKEILVADHKNLAYALAETYTPLILEQSKNVTHILAPATTFGKNILPRVAALLDVVQVSDVIDIKDKNTFVHPIYAGNALETVNVLTNKKVLTIRPTAFEPAPLSENKASVKIIDGSAYKTDKSIFKKHHKSDGNRPDLSSAQIIIAGGRGIKSAENFKLLEELADLLDAGIGASRAAVDAGFAPNDYQIGQTGKVVAPKLYIAVGISGAIQHLAGMKDSGIIIAINKDPDAPIFQVADYGFVGDLFEVIPKIIEALKK